MPNEADYIPVIAINLPEWINDIARYGAVFNSIEDRMRLCVALARENVMQGGGPFGAAVFERDSGRLVGVGVNLVVPLNNSVLHAEIVAFMDAEARVQSYSLKADRLPAHEVVTTCEPCAMCLGASLWAGVQRIVYGATREDASALQFDEGPVFPQSYEYLKARGIEIVPEILRAESRRIFKLYRDNQGPIYNA
jgi:tRNA(Arg) A34 adenosine deaminase TadA